MEGCFIDSRLKMARGFYLLSFTVLILIMNTSAIIFSAPLTMAGRQGGLDLRPLCE
jgi:hypothetical protein